MRQISASRTRRLRPGDLRLDHCAPPRLVHAHTAIDRDPRPPTRRRHAAAAADRPRLGATRPRRRRARSRPRHPRARFCAACSSLVDGVGAGSSTICVRHHSPSPSRSGSCTTKPAACRSSSQRCTLRRCARTNLAPLGTIARDRTPAHHRRQPRHQLPDRGREPRRALRVTEPEQVALDRVRARLQPIIPRRLAPPLATGPAEQRAHHDPARLGRQRLDRRPIPATRRPSRGACGSAIQRHRQRPKAPRQQASLRRRADARGTAGEVPTSRAEGLQAQDDATLEIGVGDLSGARLQLGHALMRALLSELCREAENEDRAATRSLSFSSVSSAGRGTA